MWVKMMIQFNPGGGRFVDDFALEMIKLANEHQESVQLRYEMFRFTLTARPGDKPEDLVKEWNRRVEEFHRLHDIHCSAGEGFLDDSAVPWQD